MERSIKIFVGWWSKLRSERNARFVVFHPVMGLVGARVLRRVTKREQEREREREFV